MAVVSVSRYNYDVTIFYDVIDNRTPAIATWSNTVCVVIPPGASYCLMNESNPNPKFSVKLKASSRSQLYINRLLFSI